MSVHSNLPLRTPAFRVSIAALTGHRVFQRAFILALFFTRLAGAQIDMTSIAPHRYLVVYRDAAIPGDAETRIASAGAHLTQRNEHFGIAAVMSASQDDATTLRSLAAQPNVDYVLHDRIVSARGLLLQTIGAASVGIAVTGQSPAPTSPVGRLPTHGPIFITPPVITPPPPAYDSYYNSPPGMGRPAGRRLRQQRARRPRPRPLEHHHGQGRPHRHHR